MASLITVRLSRTDASPWGFRLQGGKDFGTPLLIQKVNGGSLAERAGLIVGDALVKINNTEVFALRHKDAQDVIVRAGNSFEVTIERGPGVTWKPHVTAVGSVPSPNIMSSAPSTVTKTSLAYNKPASNPIGTGHNLTPRPFGGSSTPQINGTDPGLVKSIGSKQYNTPVGLYSEETIAETLSAQAEVLAGGVLGVNFKKNEKSYNAASSEVFKMVQEADKEPKEPEPEQVTGGGGGGVVVPPPVSGLRHVSAPETKAPTSAQAALPPGQNVCADCERLIVGVFVRIKDKNLHVECFKCATCGSSLKNVGYYNINNKLYCDIHAKLVARQNPPAPNLDPITIPPGGRIPAGLGPQSPQPGTLAPLPFHSGPKPFGAPSAPAPFSTPAAPFSTPAAPFSTPSAPFSSPAAPFSSPAAPFSSPAAPAPFTSSVAPSSPFKAPPAPAASNLSKTLPGRIPTKPFGPRKGPGGAPKSGIAGTSAPRWGRGLLNPNVGVGARIPQCGQCHRQIRGPFITALGKIWCPEHFVCVNAQCRRPLQDIGFVEEAAGLYCEYCFEQFLAPCCSKCNSKIKGDCLNAIGKHFHPECFTCAYCGKLFGNSPFFLEDALPYCENDWNELFTTKCFSCGFPIEAGDRWVEALNNNYHSQCFNCTMCKKNLEGQSFYAKGGRPFCKTHAR